MDSWTQLLILKLYSHMSMILDSGLWMNFNVVVVFYSNVRQIYICCSFEMTIHQDETFTRDNDP